MSVSGDSAEQVVRLTLEGFEVIAKLSGSGAKNLAAMLYTIFKDNSQKNTKGKTRLMNLLKSGKPLKIFTIQEDDLRTFSEQAKNLNIQFCFKKNPQGDNLSYSIYTKYYWNKNISLNENKEIIKKNINYCFEKYKRQNSCILF